MDIGRSIRKLSAQSTRGGAGAHNPQLERCYGPLACFCVVFGVEDPVEAGAWTNAGAYVERELGKILESRRRNPH